MNMKKNLFSTVFSELYLSRWLVVLYTVILSTMFTLLLSMLSFAENIPVKMENQLDERLEGSLFKADILSLTSDNAEILADIKADNIEISFLAEAVVLDGAYISSVSGKTEGEGTIAVCTSENTDDSFIISGRSNDISDNTSGKYSLWISEECAESLDIGAGDVLEFVTEDNLKFSVTAEGIYSDTYSEAEYMINAPLARAVLEAEGKTTRQSCSAVFSSYTDCRNAVLSLEEKGCEVRCTLYDKTNEVYDNIRYIRMIFIIIAVVLFICLGIILYAMNSMLIEVRSGYIAMLKCLGAGKPQIISLYLVICEPILAAGIIAGGLFGRLYIDYTSSLMEEYLSLNFSVEGMYPTLQTAAAAFIGANIVLISVFAMLCSKISGISAAALLGNAESDG